MRETKRECYDCFAKTFFSEKFSSKNVYGGHWACGQIRTSYIVHTYIRHTCENGINVHARVVMWCIRT